MLFNRSSQSLTTPPAATACLRTKNHSLIRGRPVTLLAREPPRGPAQPGTTLFVGKLRIDASDNALVDTFQRYGRVVSARVTPNWDRPGRNKGPQLSHSLHLCVIDMPHTL